VATLAPVLPSVVGQQARAGLVRHAAGLPGLEVPHSAGPWSLAGAPAAG
jgi:hypothetical protein